MQCLLELLANDSFYFEHRDQCLSKFDNLRNGVWRLQSISRFFQGHAQIVLRLLHQTDASQEVTFGLERN